jgi:MFS superfamily sulfate permease-like transporter
VKRLLSGMNPWLPPMIFVALFHVMRGAHGDALIFSVGSLLLIADWKKWFKWSMPNRPVFKRWTVMLVIAIAASVLFFSKRGGWQDVVLLLTLAPIALSIVYYRDHGPKPSSTPLMTRTRWLWLSLAVIMCLSELFAYMWASAFKDDKSYPTISIIVNPVLESPYGRGVFLTLWMLIGVGLLQVWRKR